MWALGALVIAVGVSFYFLFTNDDFILNFLAGPVLPYLPTGKLTVFHPAAAFKIIMNLSLILGTILASPVIVWHLWGFLSPALYTHEKKVVIPVLVMAVILFLAGCALSWYVILPLTLKVLTGIQAESLQPLIRMVSRIHVVEEARHVRYAREELRRQMVTAPRWSQEFTRVTSGEFARVFSVAFVNPDVYTNVGLDKREALAQVKASGHRREVMQTGSKRLTDFLDDIGVLRGVGRRLWKSSGLLA